MATDELAALQAAAEQHLHEHQEETVDAQDEERGEFDSDEQRDAHLQALKIEGDALRSQLAAAKRDVERAEEEGDEVEAARARRLVRTKERRVSEVAGELRRVLGAAGQVEKRPRRGAGRQTRSQ